MIQWTLGDATVATRVAAVGDLNGDGQADLVVAGGLLIIEGTSRSYQHSKDNAGWLFLGPFEAGSFDRASRKEWPTC